MKNNLHLTIADAAPLRVQLHNPGICFFRSLLRKALYLVILREAIEPSETLTRDSFGLIFVQTVNASRTKNLRE